MSELNYPIGWTDASDPNGQGYLIMTEIGMKVFDLEEHQEFLKEQQRVATYLKEFEGRIK